MKNLRLKAARAALDLSQQELAERVGVSRQTINAIEKGDYNPTINLCLKICHALGKTLDELFWEPAGAAVPPASAVGSVQTQTRPTSRGLVCCVSFRMKRSCGQTADGPRAGAVRLRRFLGTGRVPGFMSPLCPGNVFFKKRFFSRLTILSICYIIVGAWRIRFLRIFYKLCL